MEKFTWQEINSSNVSDSSGVYAWYYAPKISKRDIAALTQEVESSGEYSSKQEAVKSFLQKHVFSYYEEAEYEVRISGKLKASYAGQIAHELKISDTLIKRIAEKPQILNGMNEILSSIDESLMSPLYIGMAKNLSIRLTKHKKLIEDYRSQGISSSDVNHNEEEKRDHNFAARVIQKSFITINLYVVITEVSDKDSMHNVMENILNRINYPILGRN